MIQFKRTHAHDLPIPAYETAHAAGMDIRASEDAVIMPGYYGAVDTGWAVEIPPGYEIQVRPRSGLAAKHGVTVLNAPGTVDSDYRGEMKVILINHGREAFRVRAGDRIAQLVVARVEHMEATEVSELSATKRGEGGFGSTGVS